MSLPGIEAHICNTANRYSLTALLFHLTQSGDIETKIDARGIQTFTQRGMTRYREFIAFACRLYNAAHPGEEVKFEEVLDALEDMAGRAVRRYELELR